jgi:hypothetical protein
MIGKIYELVGSPTEHHVLDDNFQVIATLKQFSTFVVLEYLGDFLVEGLTTSSTKTKIILKMKILTNDGKIGYSTFWENEIQPAKHHDIQQK